MLLKNMYFVLYVNFNFSNYNFYFLLLSEYTYNGIIFANLQIIIYNNYYLLLGIYGVKLWIIP